MIDVTDPILVFGATGRQGGAVARALLHRGQVVRALVRDPQTPQAQALADAGASLVPGDLDDPPSLTSAMRDVAGVFSVQTFLAPDGVAGEERQGRAVAEAASRARVPHLVYSSVGGADRSTGVAHFESKARIERHITELDLPATVLRPTFFMDNFTRMGPKSHDGELVLTLALAPGTRLQMIATDDIGILAAEALTHPADHIGTHIEIAGDELTGPQIAAVFAHVGGTPVRFQQQPTDQLPDKDSAAMFDWFNRDGYHADLPALRKHHPDLITLIDWLDRTGWTPPTD